MIATSPTPPRSPADQRMSNGAKSDMRIAIVASAELVHALVALIPTSGFVVRSMTREQFEGAASEKQGDAFDLILAEPVDTPARLFELAHRVAPTAVVIMIANDPHFQRHGEWIDAGALDCLDMAALDRATLRDRIRLAHNTREIAAALRLQGDDMRTLFDLSPVPMWVHDEETLCFLAVNDATIRTYGYSRDAFLNMTLHDIRPQTERAKLERVVRSAMPERYEGIDWRHLTSDGRILIMAIAARALKYQGRQARFVVARDVTLQYKAIAALETSERRYREVFDNSLGLISTLDMNGCILDCNPAAARALGYEVSEQVGRRLTDYMPKWTHASFDDFLKRIADSGEESGILTLKHRDGSPRVWQYHDRLLRDDKGKPYVVSHSLDITERHADLLRLREQQAELEIAYAKLEGAQEQMVQSKKLASIGHLAAGVAHEINNPIGYVNSNLGSLKRYTEDVFGAIESLSLAIEATGNAEAIAKVAAIRREFDLEFVAEDLPKLVTQSCEGIDRVTRIVQDLKDFSRIDRAEEWVYVDIHRGLESTLNIVGSDLKYKGEVVKTYGEVPQIECLPSEINQVFMNVLMNAAQAIEKYGVISVSTGCNADRVWIEIGDTGVGIPEDLQAQIFDPFFTTKAVGSGTGLGLSISYGIVAKHHGTIQVTSELGQGSLFRIELPVQQLHRETGL